MKNHNFLAFLIFGFLTLCLTLNCGPTQSKGPQFNIYFNEEKSADPLDGRLLLLLSNNNEQEPRFQINDGPGSQLVFGIDVDGMAPGEKITFDKKAFGYPVESFSEVPAGEYYVQAIINRYETFKRSNGYTLKLPPRQRRRPALEPETGQPLLQTEEDQDLPR